MGNKIEWDDLDLSKVDKGYFATPEHIKQAMKERSKQLKIAKIATFFIIAGGLLLMLLVIWMFL